MNNLDKCIKDGTVHKLVVWHCGFLGQYMEAARNLGLINDSNEEKIRIVRCLEMEFEDMRKSF